MFDEEDSKKLRIFQREKRQELQLIIERCNKEVDFDYVCVPSIRNDKDFCFGNKHPRKIHLFAEDKSVNSYMRKQFKELFPEPPIKLEPAKKSEEDLKESEIEKPTHPFSSKVLRFPADQISSGVYRRKKKTRAAPTVTKKVFSAFGSSSERLLLLERNPNTETFPGVGVYNFDNPKKQFKFHSFGGEIKIKAAFEIVCGPKNLDSNCENCEELPKNVYYKSRTTQTVLCRACYNLKIFEVKTKTRGIIEKMQKLQLMEVDFEPKRFCDFYHEHNKTSAAIRLLSSKEFHHRIHEENLLNTIFKY